MRCVVLDIGGTNVRLSYVAGADAALADIVSMKCASFATIEDAFAAYAAQIGLDEKLNGARLDAVAIAAAGSVNTDVVSITNNHWDFEKKALCKALPTERLLVINDFTAQALAQSNPAGNGNLPILHGISDDQNPLLVIGPGTGLGVSALLPTSMGPLAIEGHGGHVSFGPRSEVEVALNDHARQKFDNVTVEHFVCGAGLEAIYEFLAGHQSPRPEKLLAPEIGAKAVSENGLCRDAALMMLDILGTAVADHTLSFGAWRGAVIAGGIVPQLHPLISASNFAERVRSVGVMSPLMANLPVWLSVDPYAGLRGAMAALASPHLASKIIFV